MTFKKSLGAATEKVNDRERAEFEKKLKSFVDVKGFADKAELKSFLNRANRYSYKRENNTWKYFFGGKFQITFRFFR